MATPMSRILLSLYHVRNARWFHCVKPARMYGWTRLIARRRCDCPTSAGTHMDPLGPLPIVVVVHPVPTVATTNAGIAQTQCISTAPPTLYSDVVFGEYAGAAAYRLMLTTTDLVLHASLSRRTHPTPGKTPSPTYPLSRSLPLSCRLSSGRGWFPASPCVVPWPGQLLGAQKAIVQHREYHINLEYGILTRLPDCVTEVAVYYERRSFRAGFCGVVRDSDLPKERFIGVQVWTRRFV
jgi:hypothetical protein